MGKCPLCGHSVIEGQKAWAVVTGKGAVNLSSGKAIEEEAYQNNGEEIAS